MISKEEYQENLNQGAKLLIESASYAIDAIYSDDRDSIQRSNGVSEYKKVEGCSLLSGCSYADIVKAVDEQVENSQDPIIKVNGIDIPWDKIGERQSTLARYHKELSNEAYKINAAVLKDEYVAIGKYHDVIDKQTKHLRNAPEPPTGVFSVFTMPLYKSRMNAWNKEQNRLVGELKNISAERENIQERKKEVDTVASERIASRDPEFAAVVQGIKMQDAKDSAIREVNHMKETQKTAGKEVIEVEP